MFAISILSVPVMARFEVQVRLPFTIVGIVICPVKGPVKVVAGVGIGVGVGVGVGDGVGAGAGAGAGADVVGGGVVAVGVGLVGPLARYPQAIITTHAAIGKDHRMVFVTASPMPP